MTNIEIVGSVGWWMIEVSYLYQIRKLYKIKESEEFDMLFPILNVTGRALALTYASLKAQHDWVIIYGLILGIFLRLTLMSQVIWYRYQRRRRLKLQEETISI